MAKMNDLSNGVSVVIATLGGVLLKETIERLNKGSIIPNEILICIPEEDLIKVKEIEFFNVKIVNTRCRGQVAQRAVGFNKANYPYVLQLDDDIDVDESCIEELLKVISSNPNIVVGPNLYDKSTGEYNSFLLPSKNKLRLFNRLFYYAANGKNGFQPGKISKSGINFGIPEVPSRFDNVDWLCGGCLMHRKKNLLLMNYYPFPGKAYAEDLFHSKLLRDNGLILTRSGEAKCYVDFTSSKGGGLANIIKNYSKPIVPMKIFVKSINGSVTRLWLVYFLIHIRLVLLRINK